MSTGESLRIGFAGTPAFALPALEALVRSEFDLVAVYTQPDRPAGRGKKLRSSEVKNLALEHKVPVFQPDSLKSEYALADLKALSLDVLVVVAYGLILPSAILATPRHGCLNIHGSLLPRWRGAAPLQRAILAGDSETGITIMHMDEGLDTGPMISQASLAIDANTTTATLHDQLAELGASALLKVLPSWCEGGMTATVQDDQLATYADKLAKSEAVIDWAQSAIDIDRRIRAFNPWPVAQTDLQGAVLRVWNSTVLEQDEPSQLQPIGTVLSCNRDGIDVQTGNGVVRLSQLQLPGKRPVSSADFANGRDITGECLGGQLASVADGKVQPQ